MSYSIGPLPVTGLIVWVIPKDTIISGVFSVVGLLAVERTTFMHTDRRCGPFCSTQYGDK